MIGMLHHRHRKYTRPFFEKMGLFRGQPPLLLLLAKKDGMTQKEIASALNLTPPTVNKMVRRMEQGGFIHKRSDPEDLRITRILLSSKGLALIGRIREVIDEEEKAISALYTTEEKNPASKNCFPG